MAASAPRRALTLFGTVVTASLVLTACSSSSGSSGSSASSDPSCAPYSAYMGHSGTTVSMFASILSPESDKLQASWAEFSKCTGITIAYEGSNDFESQLPVRVSGGNAPDLAIIPQPGLLAKMATTGKLVKAPDAVSANVDKYWNKAWKSYATVSGTFYGAPMGSNMKSFVWYSPSAFTAGGYTVPTTWADLMTLSDKIAAAGKAKPWCGGIGSGTATGWPATDWLEEVVLRQLGPDAYDQWTTNALKFNSPQIKSAMDTVNGWMRNPKYVNAGFGDVKSIASTTFQDAGTPILKNNCYMLQQASFYAAQWPKGTKVDPAGDVFAFYLPPMGTTYGKPVEGGGEFVAAFSDKPEVGIVQQYLSTPEWADSRIKQGSGWVSANNGVDISLYTSPIDKLSAQYLVDPQATFRFDASDLMPAAVGAGSFWKQMTAWFGENKDTQAVLDAIQASWPTS
jgi:alpha-glucoside transport system substrate-binding protein